MPFCFLFISPASIAANLSTELYFPPCTVQYVRWIQSTQHDASRRFVPNQATSFWQLGHPSVKLYRSAQNKENEMWRPLAPSCFNRCPWWRTRWFVCFVLQKFSLVFKLSYRMHFQAPQHTSLFTRPFIGE
jgi:hypothetical protein